MTIQLNNIVRHPSESRGYWLRRMGLGWLLLLMTAWLSWSGCAPRVRVLTGAEAITRVQPGQTITATNGGYLVSDAMMKRILQDIADATLREQTRPHN